MPDLTSPQMLAFVFITPGVFSLSLLIEGINKVMNYDPSGWVSAVAGVGVFIVVLFAYIAFTTNYFN